MAFSTKVKQDANGKRQVEVGSLWKRDTPMAVICHWSDVEPQVIRGCVDAITRAGGAIMLGLTSDGGAFSICVLYDQDKIKEYPHGTSECTDLLLALTQYFVDKIEL